MDAPLLGRLSKTLSEEPYALALLKSGMTGSAEELRSSVAARLVAFKVPIKPNFSREPLIRNANGEFLKSELRQLLPG